MRYLLNIGNTHTQLAVSRDGEPALLERYDTADLLASGHLPLLDDDRSPWTAVATSVVPPVRQLLQETYGPRLHFLAADNFPQIDFSLVDTSTLGIDRICNAAGALSTVGHGPVIVFDCGTCLASVALDATARFRGGTIAPGRALLRHALHDHTAQLPFVPLQDALPCPLGTTTRDAILAGTDLAAVGTLQTLITATRQALQAPGCPVLLTGGDAPFFLKHLHDNSLSPAPELLTLRGVLAATV